MKELTSERKIDCNGYAYTKDTFGILGKKGANVPEHRLIASLLIGRPLKSDELVHHLDLNRSNNSPDNLVIVNSKEHGEFHSNGNVVRRTKQKTPVSFEGKTSFVKMKCPWCGKIFFRARKYTVLVNDNSLHVNCCSIKCTKRLKDSVELGECEDLGVRVRNNIVCEFKSNYAFMDEYKKGKLPSQWFIDDYGVFHGDDN